MEAAVASAAQAQKAWGATNPQKRARVLMEMVRLINRDMDKLAEAISREHGMPFPDARATCRRALTVIEVLLGWPTF